MDVGLSLEIIQRAGVWNESAGDLFTYIVQSAGWPADIPLRIVDTDTGAIHLYRHGKPEQSHCHAGAELLPPVKNDIILLLHKPVGQGAHYDLLGQEGGPLIEEVAADGDCFFSCISKARNSENIATSNLELRRQLADQLWEEPDALQVLRAPELPLNEQHTTGPAPPDGYIVENGHLIPVPDYDDGDDPRVTPPTGEIDGVDTVAARDAERAESNAGLAVIPQMVTAYDVEMKRYLADAVYSPKVFSAIHARLAGDLVGQAAGILNAGDTPDLQQQMQAALDRAFKAHKATNLENIKRQQTRITKALETANTHYVEQIEAVLTEHPEGLDEADLSGRSAAITQQVIATMKAELNAISADEPLEGHQQSITSYIARYWETVREANAENLAARVAAPPSPTSIQV